MTSLNPAALAILNAAAQIELKYADTDEADYLNDIRAELRHGRETTKQQVAIDAIDDALKVVDTHEQIFLGSSAW